MLSEAEKYAAADKEKRQSIDLKNQAEALCFEAEKELSLLKDNISEDKQEEVKKLIENIRQEIQNNNISELTSKVEELKTAMKDMIEAKSMENDASSDPMSNLNDL